MLAKSIMRLTAFRILVIFGCLLVLEGQSKKPPNPSDYGQWETLVSTGRFGGLSPDGKWLAYGINRSNGKHELRLARTDSEVTKDHRVRIAAGVFSSDSRWAAYAIGYSEAQQEKLRKDKKPVHNKLGLTNLATGEQSEIEGVEIFRIQPFGDVARDAALSARKDCRPGREAPTVPLRRKMRVRWRGIDCP